MIRPEQDIDQVVLDHAECAEVFRRHGIAFCCGGGVTVASAAAARGIALTELLRELTRAVATRDEPRLVDPRDLSTAKLIDYIVVLHHQYLRDAFPGVCALARKVARVHGGDDPRLVTLAELVEGFSELLLSHIDEEEATLFPALRRAVGGPPGAAADLADNLSEHRAIGAQMKRIRATTGDFAVPDWACTSYRTLFTELKAIERDTLEHVSIENHVLAPRFRLPAVNPAPRPLAAG